MDLQLVQSDLLQVSFVGRNTLQLLPPGKRPTRKVAIGDNDGCVEVFGVKKGEITRVFKQQLGTKGEAISRLALGGKSGKKEQIYAAQGTTIRGVTKKGKEFFKLKTTLSETISSMYVEDNSIWTTGEYVFTKFEDGKDRFFALATDRIREMTVSHFMGLDERGVILSCQDRFLRMVIQDTFHHEKLIPGAAAALTWNQSAGGSTSAASVDEQATRLPGGQNGVIGQMMVNNTAFADGWIVPNVNKAGSITNMGVADLTKDGLNDVVVGRDDGLVEVYCFDVSPRDPQMNFKRSVGESIRSLEAGHVSMTEYDEIIVATYSGKVMSYSNDVPAEDEAGVGLAVEGTAAKEDDPLAKRERRKKRKDNSRKQLRALREEVDKLAEKLAEKKTRQLQTTDEVISTHVNFHVNQSIRLIPEEAAYAITIEIENALDSIVLQSDVQLNLLDVDDNLAIVCKSDVDARQDKTSKVLATYRCQDSVNRIQVKLRTFEGKQGNIKVYVIPRASPKTSQLLVFPIKPLSLHERVYNLAANTPMNTLKFTGKFSLLDVHSWLSMALPDVPAKTGDADTLQMCFQSTFLSTVVLTTSRKGEVSVKSDSVSSIAMVKEVITREAVNRKVQLNLSVDVNNDSIEHVLNLVRDRLTPLFQLSQRKKALDALSEIKMQEEDLSFLDPEYLTTLENATAIEKEYASQEEQLQFLYHIIRSLYLDYHSLRGRDGSGGMEGLDRIISRYDHDAVLAYFAQASN
eukprot:CAMPEP_0113915080 /NCGR_PEP_ID=MMETSP0780_2-20120614/30956_1 /TAXON_ID=652834 /ORGANISM="Palpitomonas bilix" /LENGTH=744 /DNA_ID=CAMNT_0000913455 /DNA_START=35 /DNA_END=2269 /DNA_ORIENTATION=+ /assembly_acc=CAM_ASM_000599